MNEQPKALRLADDLDQWSHTTLDVHEAAAELRRLHEMNAELLEALEDIEMVGDENGGVGTYLAKLARKAIAKTEGEQA
jgi:hypothetical protein